MFLPTPFFAAKCYWPGVTEQSLELAARRAGARCAGSILFRDHELALCLFDAASSASVRRTAEAAGIPCERVMDALWLPNHPHHADLGQPGEPRKRRRDRRRTRRDARRRQHGLPNGDLGISAVLGVIDGRGNHAFGNSHPAQCTHITC